MSTKGSLGNINLLHMNLVIAKTKIKFGKKMSTSKFIQRIINDWNEKFILDGDFVDNMKN
jgi:hypothetical protein